MSCGWFIRLQILEGYAEKVQLLKFVDEYTRILVAKHTGEKTKENPHWHLVVETQVKEKAFRARMVKIFNSGKGNGHMAMKPWDGNIKACSYGFHEKGAPIVLNKGFTPEDITAFENLNAGIQEKVKIAKGKASHLLLNDVLQDPSIVKTSSVYDIAKCMVLTALRGDKYLPNDFMLKNLSDRIRFIKQDGDVHAEEQVADEIVRRALRL